MGLSVGKRGHSWPALLPPAATPWHTTASAACLLAAATANLGLPHRYLRRRMVGNARLAQSCLRWYGPCCRRRAAAAAASPARPAASTPCAAVSLLPAGSIEGLRHLSNLQVELLCQRGAPDLECEGRAVSSSRREEHLRAQGSRVMGGHLMGGRVNNI